MLDAIPKIGYGTWQRRGDEARNGVLAALEAGYRHIDTAEGYENEKDVGQGIAESGVARDDFWITTKVAPENFGPGEVRPHAEASLERLGLDQVDLLLAHWPSIDDKYDIEDYLGQLADVKAAGLARTIGVSNFTIRHIDKAVEILGADAITTNQIELHPFLANRPIVEHCKSLGIPLTAYCPLARRAVPEDVTLQGIADDIGATPSQVALSYLMAQGYIVIPSSSNTDRIAENLAATEVQLTAAQLKTIDGLDRNMRCVNGSWCPAWDEE
ncbi:aldo/keto reductase [Pelagovum pacificum]|uniref:Aldo/keto reductase n=1 Tax=Pelagovum pacificum TaxID=2588711 RepID=A0A5C5GC90_9RHOB|nr:aldo/keto reductase [Pelagovum pacificum]QQA42508.1 aldo/keto reductase [Pelagovum pacificum]TNY31592.1 aldo/keto reductase [Pelagovum pacificum]